MTCLLRIVIALIPIVLLGWVSWSYLDLDGETTIVWEAGEVSPFVHGLRPTGRVEPVRDEGTGAFHRLSGDPVYLSVTPPGNYETVNVDVWFNAREQPMVELGATVNAEAGQIDLRALQHQTLDALDWSVIRNDDLTLYQRRPVYDSVGDLLRDPPPLSSIATYHYDLPEPDAMPRAWTSGAPVAQAVSLRGNHEFLAATDGRRLTLDVMYMDMNRNPGADPIAVRVYQNGEVVASQNIPDDGVVDATNAALGRDTFRLEATGLMPGLVKVELQANNDVYWRSITSNLSKMTFARNVFVGDEVGYSDDLRPVTLWTDAQHLMFLTRHAEGVQTVTVGDERIDIAIPHEQYNVENDRAGLTKVTIPRGDLLVVTDGRVAFSPEAFFNPFPVQMDDRTDLDKLQVDYVIAKVPEARRSGAWTVAGAQFWVPGLEVERARDEATGSQEGSRRFVISLPRVHERGAFVDVHKVELTFRRPTRTFMDVIRRLGSQFERQ